MVKKLRVSAVLPVYNEEKTVKGVIEVLLKSPLLDEIVVVNDGSKDSSAGIIRSFGSKIRFVDLKKNKGKGNALVEGIKAAKGEIVAFFDADYTKFTVDHIETLLLPVLEGKARVVMGIGPISKKDPSGYLWRSLTGMRVYYKKDLETSLDIDVLAKARFGAEVYLNTLNKLFPKNQVCEVELQGLDLLLKYQKTSKREAVKDYTKAALEIVKQLANHKKKSLDEITKDYFSR